MDRFKKTSAEKIRCDIQLAKHHLNTEEGKKMEQSVIGSKISIHPLTNF